MAEPIEMPFGVWTRVSPMNHNMGAQIPPGQGVIWEGASLGPPLECSQYSQLYLVSSSGEWVT